MQSLSGAQESSSSAEAEPGNAVTVRGLVRNAATGEPLPRALVRIEGNANTGALTDGEGRFEISGVPTGPQAFQVVKPGFRDRPYATGGMLLDDAIGPPHNIFVSAEMHDLEFAIAPTCSIRGQIELSTGDPAQGIQILLLRRMVEEGRAIWMEASESKTRDDGSYRFAGLADGVYAIETQPAMDTESPFGMVEATRTGNQSHAGFASMFYPDARDLAGATKINLTNGTQAQANLTLTLEPFQTVSAVALIPHTGPAASEAAFAGANYAATVLDAAGHRLPYQTRFDPATGAAQAILPDGAYTLVISSQQKRGGLMVFDGPGDSLANSKGLLGSVDFTVAEHPIMNLQVPLSVRSPNQVQLTMVRSASSSAPAQPIPASITVLARQAGESVADGSIPSYAQDLRPGANSAANLPAGLYWVRTLLSPYLCEQSFTAGGANLAHEPLVLGVSGSAPPSELTVRDDCAKLTLSLPQILAAQSAPEEPFYAVYAVPDFETTVALYPVTLRPSSGGAITLESLTPGSYHIYTFNSPVQLEYRNPAVLAALPNPGQAVTLSPGATTHLIVEVPAR